MARMQTTIWRRHAPHCPHSTKGRDYLKCSCPLWGDGYRDGRRDFRKSLKTRDMSIARKRLAELESAGRTDRKTIKEARVAYMSHGKSQGHSRETLKKARNVLRRLNDFCDTHRIETIRQVTTPDLDIYRASRNISPLTASKELEILKQFFNFCADRKWADESPAKVIKVRRKFDDPEIDPYTPEEIQAMLNATGRFGKGSYERARAFAMVLVFRYTALRISDVALLEKSRFRQEGERWKMRVRTLKNGVPVYMSVPAFLVETLFALPLPRGADPEVGCKYFFWSGKGDQRSMVSVAYRMLKAVFRASKVQKAKSHRFRHTLATDLIANHGAAFEEVADILGNTVEIVRKHYAKWAPGRQRRIDDLMDRYANAESGDRHILGTQLPN